MNWIATTIIVLSVSLTATPAFADSVVRSGETVSVVADQTVEGDFYTAASIINISGAITEDLVAAGGKLTLNGSVADDVIVIAGATDIHGAVGGDVRIVAGETLLAEPVAGDVFVIGGALEILSTASVAGDVLFFGGEVTIAGEVAGDVLGYAGSVRIDAPVGGAVTVTTDSLTLGDRANLAGDLIYTSADVMTRSQNAVIAGEVNRNDPIVTRAPAQLRTSFLLLIGLLFASSAWLLIARRSLVRVTMQASRSVAWSVMVGILVLFGGPLVGTILVASLIGFIPGLVILFAYAGAILLAMAGMIPVLGQIVYGMMKKTTPSLSVLTLGVGAVGVWCLMLIPIVGAVVLLLLFLQVLGAVAASLAKGVKS